MDPIKAQQLFAAGKITQETLDAIMAKADTGFRPTLSGAPEQPLNPPTPPPAVSAPADIALGTGLDKTDDQLMGALRESPAVPAAPSAPAPSPVDSSIGDLGDQDWVKRQLGEATDTPAPIPTPELTAPATEEPAPSAPTPSPTISTGQMVTGEKQSITSTEKKAHPEAEKAHKRLTDSMDQAAEAEADLAEIARQKAHDEFNLNQARQTVIESTNAAQQTIRDKGQKEIEDTLADIKAKTEELSNREYKGYWQRKGTGDKIMGALALAMGTFSSSQTGGPNTAMLIINKAMDADFDAFKDVTKNKIAAINSSRLGVQDKRNLIKDQINGLQANKAASVEVIQNKIANLSNKFADPAHKAKLKQLSAQLEERKAKSAATFYKDLGETITTKIEKELTQVQLVDGQVVTPKRDPSAGEKAVDTDYAKTYSKYSGKGRNNVLASLEKLEKIQQELEADSGMIQSGGGSITGSIIPDFLRTEDSIRRRDLSHSAANATLKELFGGAMSNEERIAEAGTFYNDKLDNAENAKILKAKIADMRRNMATEDARAKYWEEHGTLQGFKVSTGDQALPKTDNASKPYRVKQGGKSYVWNGSQYIEEK